MLVFYNTTASAEEIGIAIGMSLPPYVIEEQNAGMEVEIIREALKTKGHTAIFFYVPNLRIPIFLKEKKADGIAANSAYDVGKDIGMSVFPSSTTVIYQNYAISLEENPIQIGSMEDLSEKSIIAFNNATKYLGPAFASVVEKNPQYEESADQSKQVIRIYTKQSDVAISDKKVFLYWRNIINNRSRFKPSEINKPLNFFPIFPPAPRNCTFIEARKRNEFNEGLRIIRENGVYDTILKKYERLYKSR